MTLTWLLAKCLNIFTTNMILAIQLLSYTTICAASTLLILLTIHHSYKMDLINTVKSELSISLYLVARWLYINLNVNA